MQITGRVKNWKIQRLLPDFCPVMGHVRSHPNGNNSWSLRIFFTFHRKRTDRFSCRPWLKIKSFDSYYFQLLQVFLTYCCFKLVFVCFCWMLLFTPKLGGIWFQTSLGWFFLHFSSVLEYSIWIPTLLETVCFRPLNDVNLFNVSAVVSYSVVQPRWVPLCIRLNLEPQFVLVSVGQFFNGLGGRILIFEFVFYLFIKTPHKLI